MSDIEQRIIEAMTEFVNNLESGVPIEATRIRRVDTPDGPMHQREHVVLNTGPKTIPCDECEDGYVDPAVIEVTSELKGEDDGK